MFINSCFAHCQSELQETWFGDDSPRINNKVAISLTTRHDDNLIWFIVCNQTKLLYLLQTIAEAVGDWYFSRNRSKQIDRPYPCDNDKTCHNLIP